MERPENSQELKYIERPKIVLPKIVGRPNLTPEHLNPKITEGVSK